MVSPSTPSWLPAPSWARSGAPSGQSAPTASPPPVQSYSSPGQTPYDGSRLTGQVGSQGAGGFGITPDFLASLLGGGPTSPQLGTAMAYDPARGEYNPGMMSGPTMQTGQQPSTYAVGQPGQFGFAPGAIGSFGGSQAGDVVSFMQAAGFPQAAIDLMMGLQGGQGVQRPNYNATSQQYGGTSLPSLQSYMNMGPTGQEFFAGLLQTLLGIPMNDALFSMMQPWEDMQRGQQASTRGLGGLPTR